MDLKLLGKQEQTKPETSRLREIIKISDEINEIKTKKTIQRINETKSWLFKKFSKINKSLANLTRQRREKTQINNINYQKVDITRNTDEIQMIIWST
jgi:hypothetical protein